MKGMAAEMLPDVASNLSGWGVVGVLVIMLLTGRGLATRREVDAEKARADLWQDAWKAERTANSEKDRHIEELVENSRATAKVLAVLQEQSTRLEERSQEWGSS